MLSAMLPEAERYTVVVSFLMTHLNNVFRARMCKSKALQNQPTFMIREPCAPWMQCRQAQNIITGYLGDWDTLYSELLFLGSLMRIQHLKCHGSVKSSSSGEDTLIQGKSGRVKSMYGANTLIPYTQIGKNSWHSLCSQIDGCQEICRKHLHHYLRDKFSLAGSLKVCKAKSRQPGFWWESRLSCLAVQRTLQVAQAVELDGVQSLRGEVYYTWGFMMQGGKPERDNKFLISPRNSSANRHPPAKKAKSSPTIRGSLILCHWPCSPNLWATVSRTETILGSLTTGM